MVLRRGEIDINRADLKEFSRIPGVKEEDINAILSYREKHGPFKNWSDFDEMPGLESSLKERVHFFTNLGNEG